MTTIIVPTPDVEKILPDWVETTLTGHQCSTDTPPDLAGELPFHRLNVITGNDLEITLGQVVIHVDTFGANRGDANTAALAMKDALTYLLSGSVFLSQGAAFGQVRCTLWPSWLPWDNTNVRRLGATYVAIVHALQPS